MKLNIKQVRVTFFLVVILIFVWIISFAFDWSDGRKPEWGIVFTPSYARYLGLNPGETYTTLLDELGVKYIRLAAYWNEIEKQEGENDWRELDWMMDEAARRGVKVILASGRRLPHWPECHFPRWLINGSTEAFVQSLALDKRGLEFHERVVRRYRSHPALEMWQIENEPFVGFFGCDASAASLVEKEINIVRRLDPNHKILITDSGELSSWRKTAKRGDFLGITLYRSVYNPYLGSFNYDFIIPAAFYRLKARLVGQPTNLIFISELQAEPWAPAGILSLSAKDQMTSARLQKNITLARRTGFPRVYLWGAEYWYWLKAKHNDPTLWELVKKEIK